MTELLSLPTRAARADDSLVLDGPSGPGRVLAGHLFRAAPLIDEDFLSFVAANGDDLDKIWRQIADGGDVIGREYVDGDPIAPSHGGVGWVWFSPGPTDDKYVSLRTIAPLLMPGVHGPIAVETRVLHADDAVFVVGFTDPFSDFWSRSLFCEVYLGPDGSLYVTVDRTGSSPDPVALDASASLAAPVVIRLELDDGTARFYINGTLVHTVTGPEVPKDDDRLCPFFAAVRPGEGVKLVAVDYFRVWGTR